MVFSEEVPEPVGPASGWSLMLTVPLLLCYCTCSLYPLAQSTKGNYTVLDLADIVPKSLGRKSIKALLSGPEELAAALYSCQRPFRLVNYQAQP